MKRKINVMYDILWQIDSAKSNNPTHEMKLKTIKIRNQVGNS